MGEFSEQWESGLGDEWFSRNKEDLGVDRLEGLFQEFTVKEGSRIFEVGCSNGWRLKKYEKMGYEVYGIDPSKAAIKEANHPNIKLGTADNYEISPQVDVIIFGYCLYVTDPEDYPAIVATADKALRIGGLLIIEDRMAQSGTIIRDIVTYKGDTVTNKRKNEYKEDGEWTMHKMITFHFPDLWTIFPTYRLVYSYIFRELGTAVYVIQKREPLYNTGRTAAVKCCHLINPAIEDEDSIIMPNLTKP